MSSPHLPRFGFAQQLTRVESAPTLGPRPTSSHQCISPQRPPVGHVLSRERVWGTPNLYLLPDPSLSKSPRRPRCVFDRAPQRPLLRTAEAREAAAFRLYAPPSADAFKQPRQPAVRLHWGGAADHGRGHQTVAHTAPGVSSIGGLTSADDRPANPSRPRPHAVEPLARTPNVPSWVERVATPRAGWTGRGPPPRPISRGYDAIIYR